MDQSASSSSPSHSSSDGQPEGVPSTQSIIERLQEPATANVLHRLLDRAEGFEKTLEAMEQLPNLIAIAVDFFDSISQRAAEEGVDIEARSQHLFQVLIQLTEPQNLNAIQALVSNLPQLSANAELMKELPNLIATATDVFDQWASEQQEKGIDLETSLRQGLHAALWLGGQIRTVELERLGFLLKSDVMNQFSVETVGMAGAALSSCRQGTCEHPVPKRIGLFGMLAALRDPSTQRALAFGVQFAKCFGTVLDATHPGSNQLCNPSVSGAKQ